MDGSEQDALPSKELFYGMPYAGVKPLQPDLTAPDHQWPCSVIAKSRSPFLPVLNPSPALSAPQNVHYPQANIYTLEPTMAYRSGYIYTSSYLTSTREAQYQRMLQIQTPPGAEALLLDNGEIMCPPIPGMIQMPAGIPFVNYIDGDRHRPITVATLHTLHSMDAYAEGLEVRNLSEKLRKLIWGCPPLSESDPGIPAFYAANLKHNLRSGNPGTSARETYDGSFSLGVTKGEGEGRGVGIPALQNGTDAVKDQISQILCLVHGLYRAIAPCALSHFELEMIDFNNNDNNVFGFGGLAPNNTGCQANVSSGLADLWELIGRLQGAWHTDINDCICRWTFLVFLLRLPPGAWHSFLLLSL